MSNVTISLIVFVLVFGGALLGIFLSSALPQDHLNETSKDVVRTGIGLVVLIAGLVLGLLVASAKQYYDAQSNELNAMSAKIVLLDRVLAHYGPETREARDLLRSDLVLMLNQLWSKNRTSLQPSLAIRKGFYDELQGLSPRTDAQRSIQAQALGITLALAEMRWLRYEQSATAVSWPLLVVLVFWLTIIFASFGLFAPRNVTVIAAFLLSGLSVSGAIFLILELDRSFEGIIQVSTAPLRAALARLGPL